MLVESFDAIMGALPRGKVVKKPVVTKLWVNGKGSLRQRGMV